MALHRNRFSFALLMLGLSFAAPLAAQVITPPRVHWIGPDTATCDYPTIQDALADIFNCGIFACPPGRNELHLSNAYTHFGQVVVNKSFDIRGSFLTCEGASSGFPTTLNAPAGQPLFLIQPGSGSINNEFRFVSMVGSANATDNGGVIRMDAGDASLTLRDSRVQDGNATSGGGIYLSGDGNRLELIASTIKLNQATKGGGIFCTNGGVVDFQSGFIEDNTAERSGGGVYLETGCELIGKTPRVDRQILRNTVTDIQHGEGAGIYALASTINMGALLSFTIIQQNVVDWFPLHDYDEPGQNRGGGVHLEAADATFYNTWFRENEAADGGAISAAGLSKLLVDRHSGPCRFGDAGNTVDCSLFEFNRARGGEEDGGEDEGGDGAVLFTQSASGSFPDTTINRSTLRSNFASCFEINPPFFTGECDLDSTTTGPIHVSSTSMVSVVSAMVGNLIYGNDIGDDSDCSPFGCSKLGHYIGHAVMFAENTMAENNDSDGVFRTRPVQIINNVVWDFSPDEGVDPVFGDERTADLSSCNISNFAEEFDELAESVPVAGLDEDPLFVNPDLNTSPNEDFRVQMPSSPAIDRCDDQDGRLTLTYDIVGTPRAIDIAGIGNGPGERDAGAFETVPGGFVNETADLVVNIESDLPKRAEIGERHAFTIDVTNTGRNAVSALRVELSAVSFLESLRGANAVDLSGNLTPVWDCDMAMARCDYLLSALIVGGGTTPITAEYSYASSGQKTVTASVLMQDASLTELTPGNNEASDTVTVGPGADLEIDLVSAFPGQIGLNQPQLFFVDVRNNGPEPATGVEVQMDLAASGGQIDSFDAFDWDCDIATATCILPTTLQPDPQSPSNFAVNISYDQPGSKALSATASATDGTGDPDPFNNRDVGFVNVLAPPTEELFADGFED